MSAGVVTQLAPAKVNLWLRVLARRADGYHELETLMLALELADVLRARATHHGQVELEVRGPLATSDIPADERNLAWRAAAAALERGRALGELGPSHGVALELEKHVPSRAGLGGGSSDASAALRAVEEAHGFELGEGWCRDFLARAGADCVFFHAVGSSGLALCRGAGERVEPRPGVAPDWALWVLTPEVECPTGAVFHAVLPRDARSAPLPRLDPEATLPEVRGALWNDLEGAALSAVPELHPWRRMLDEAGAHHARLSGSGSSFFALHGSPEAARAELDGLLRAAEARGLRHRMAVVTRNAQIS